MPSDELPMRRIIIILAIVTIALNGCTYASDKCVDVNYIKFTSLYYVAVSKQQLLSEADKSMKIENSYLIALYNKYKQLPGSSEEAKGGDFRLAFKPCNQSDWAFVSMDEKISMASRSFKLTDDEFNRLVSEGASWK